MRCASCGSMNPASAATCARCGKPQHAGAPPAPAPPPAPALRTPVAAAVPQVMCPKCHKSFPLGSKFCGYCGTPLPASPQAAPPPPPMHSRHRRQDQSLRRRDPWLRLHLRRHHPSPGPPRLRARWLRLHHLRRDRWRHLLRHRPVARPAPPPPRPVAPPPPPPPPPPVAKPPGPTMNIPESAMEGTVCFPGLRAAPRIEAKISEKKPDGSWGRPCRSPRRRLSAGRIAT